MRASVIGFPDYGVVKRVPIFAAPDKSAKTADLTIARFVGRYGSNK